MGKIRIWVAETIEADAALLPLMLSSLVQFLAIRREEEEDPLVEDLLAADRSEAADLEDSAADPLAVEVQAVPGSGNRAQCCSTQYASTLPLQIFLQSCLQEGVLQCLPY